MDAEQSKAETGTPIIEQNDNDKLKGEGCPKSFKLPISKFSIRKRVLAILISVIIISIGIFSANVLSAKSPNNQTKNVSTPNTSTDIKWNTSELDAFKNGNINLAINLFQTNTKQVPVFSERAATVMKQPWKYYGKMLKLMGRVLSVQDYPPDSPVSIKLGGSCAEAVVQGFYGTPINYLIIGDSGNMVAGSYAVLYGYTPGIIYIESNGTTIPELALIGNPVNHPTTKSAEEVTYKQLSDQQKSEEQSALQEREQAKQRAQQQAPSQQQVQVNSNPNKPNPSVSPSIGGNAQVQQPSAQIDITQFNDTLKSFGFSASSVAKTISPNHEHELYAVVGQSLTSPSNQWELFFFDGSKILEPFILTKEGSSRIAKTNSSTPITVETPNDPGVFKVHFSSTTITYTWHDYNLNADKSQPYYSPLTFYASSDAP